jgi:hypothetical protein
MCMCELEKWMVGVGMLGVFQGGVRVRGRKLVAKVSSLFFLQATCDTLRARASPWLLPFSTSGGLIPRLPIPLHPLFYAHAQRSE